MIAQELAGLVAKLFITIKVLAGYPVPDVPPEVRLVPRAELAAMVCAGRCRVIGAYLPAGGILLVDELDPVNDVRARSVLLHEMVHYLQDLHGRFADSRPCVRFLLREREAYAVQNRYLGRYSEPRDHGMVALTWNAAGCAFG